MNNSADKEIAIRLLTTVAEMKDVEELQRVVWRVPDIEVVPNSVLIATAAAGGSLLGAFDGAEMVGFVYGFGGFEDGRPAHHSHMLAVRPEYRNYRLGERLKLAQRDFVLQQGVSIMSWTFDPLQSLNAHFNFGKLGVVCDRYYIDFYGDDAPSFLHRNSTDRLWVTWDLAKESAGRPADAEDAPTVVACERGDIPEVDESAFLAGGRLAIEIPDDINRLQEADLPLAVKWREATRRAFTRAFEEGYLAEGFGRVTREDRRVGRYLLRKKD